MNPCPLCGSSNIKPVANRYLQTGGREPSLIVHYQCNTCRHAWGSQHLSQAEGQAWMRAHGAELTALECATILVQRLASVLRNARGGWSPGDDVAGLLRAAQEWLTEHPVRGRFLTEPEWQRLLALVETDRGWKDRMLLNCLHDNARWAGGAAGRP